MSCASRVVACAAHVIACHHPRCRRQAHESPLFLSYFRDTGGLMYLQGGVASGFAHVEPDVYPTRCVRGDARLRQHGDVAVTWPRCGAVMALCRARVRVMGCACE